jgi:two-component system sensor histidine kinase SenX3
MAFHNLIENAINYSPDKTRVAVNTTIAGEILEVAVIDQGVGISDADQARIFERFYRVDPARSRVTGGTGLGLSIVKHVIGNHGGDIAVWSSAGVGSTFTIRLPIADDSADVGAR